MNAKHTPGPWRVAPSNLYPSGINIDSVSVNKYVCLVAGNRDDKQGQEDARLIAAAPELLEALKALMRNFPTDFDLDVAGWDAGDIETAMQAHDIARAAIDKAQGGAV